MMLSLEQILTFLETAHHPADIFTATLTAAQPDLAGKEACRLVLRFLASRRHLEPELCVSLQQWVISAVEPQHLPFWCDSLAQQGSQNAMWLRAQLLLEAKRFEPSAAAFQQLAARNIGSFHEVCHSWAVSLLSSNRPDKAYEVLCDSMRRSPSYQWVERGVRLLNRILQRYRPPLRHSARIAVMGSSTTRLIAPVLELFCYRDGIEPVLYEAEYGQFRQNIIDSRSELSRFRPDIVILATHYRDAHLEGHAPDAAGLESYMASLKELWNLCTSRFNCHVIQHNCDLPLDTPHGILGYQLPGGCDLLLRRLNVELVLQKSPAVSILDLDLIASEFGKDRWFDPRSWVLAKQHPAPDAIPLLVEHYMAHIRSLLGLGKKCLVLDLDNTLWGGVVAEDGVANLILGEGNPAGEAYLELQRYCRGLKERGVILAVSSKNNPADAQLAFEHPEMLLQLADFAVFRANWEPKPQNLRAIACALNIGLDSMVFMDDSRLERAMVREELPEVAVLELPEDPSYFVRALRQTLYFEQLTFSAEDQLRAHSYQHNAQRMAHAASAASMDEFLASLEMVAEMASFDDLNLPRIAQLINKTNQFNLTTRRYMAKQVRAFMTSPQYLTLRVRLRDRYGDYGLISALIGKVDGDVLEIDTWVMSCRALGRGVEAAAFSQLARLAQERGLRGIRGVFIPSPRNSMVKDLYAQLEFRPVEYCSHDGGDCSCWLFDLRTQPIRGSCFLQVTWGGVATATSAP